MYVIFYNKSFEYIVGVNKNTECEEKSYILSSSFSLAYYDNSKFAE